MNGSSLAAWLVGHKESAFAALCTVVGGTFGLSKWLVSLKHANDGPGGARLTMDGTANSAALISSGGSIGNVIVGSNNVQTITTILPEQNVPLAKRPQSSPTGNEIRQKQASATKDLPLYLQEEARKKFLASFAGVEVAWLIRISEVRARDEHENVLIVEGRFGEETWGALIGFVLSGADCPKLKTINDGHRAFVEGKIRKIEQYGQIILDVSSIEIE